MAELAPHLHIYEIQFLLLWVTQWMTPLFSLSLLKSPTALAAVPDQKWSPS